MGSNNPEDRGPEWALAIDAGGTCFKSALVTAAGELVPGSRKTRSVNSSGPRAGILDVYKVILEEAMERIQVANKRLAGIGIATPGPFNIHTRESLMVHKFQNLYGLDLAKEIRCHARLAGKPYIGFMHDAHAFLSGECWRGHGRGFSRVAAVTLGTGLGFGVSMNQVILENKIGGPRYSIYRMEHAGSILENRISRRGILATYSGKTAGPSPNVLDVADLAENARSGKDVIADTVFQETGQILLDVLIPLCNDLSIECLIFGGQISKAFDLMQISLEIARSNIPSLKCLKAAAHIDDSSIYGAAKLVFDAVS